MLAHQEYGRTELRQREILTGKVDIPRTYDAEHVRAIHRHLFQDVYAWAGELRTVGIQKGPRAFAEVRDGEIGRYLDDVHRLTTGTRWADLGRDEFAERAATVFAHLNQAHPRPHPAGAAHRSRSLTGARHNRNGSEPAPAQAKGRLSADRRDKGPHPQGCGPSPVGARRRRPYVRGMFVVTVPSVAASTHSRTARACSCVTCASKTTPAPEGGMSRRSVNDWVARPESSTQ